MKKCFVYLLLAALSFMSCYGLFACRSFKKSRSSVDSTVTRSAEQKQAWQTETVQELVIEADDFSFVQPGASLPSVLDLAPQAPVGILEKLGFVRGDSNQVKTRPPGKKKGVARVTLRKVTRESSQQSSQLQEEKDVSTDHREKARESSGTGLLSFALLTVGFLIVIVLLFKSKYPD